MNRFILIKIPFLFSLMFISVFCREKHTIYYVNPSKLLQNYNGTIFYKESLKAKTQSWEQHLDSLKIELQTVNNTSKAYYAVKEQQLLRYRAAIQQQAQQEDHRITTAVLNEINIYLKQYGKDHGYTFILGATENGNIVYAAEGTDITDDVLKGLNEQYDRQRSPTTR